MHHNIGLVSHEAHLQKLIALGGHLLEDVRRRKNRLQVLPGALRRHAQVTHPNSDFELPESVSIRDMLSSGLMRTAL